MTEPTYESEPSYDVRDALTAVLLFHSGGEWTADKAGVWLRITGTREATTKVLCDHVRSALAMIDEMGGQPGGKSPCSKV